MLNYTPLSLVASATVNPSRFCKISGARTTAQAGANERIIGISGVGTRSPTDSNPTAHAVATEAVMLHRVGAEALLDIGGNIAAGDRLKADANGKGVTMASTGTTIQHYGAIALESGADGDRIRVAIVIGSERPALS